MNFVYNQALEEEWKTLSEEEKIIQKLMNKRLPRSVKQ